MYIDDISLIYVIIWVPLRGDMSIPSGWILTSLCPNCESLEPDCLLTLYVCLIRLNWYERSLWRKLESFVTAPIGLLLFYELSETLKAFFFQVVKWKEVLKGNLVSSYNVYFIIFLKRWPRLYLQKQFSVTIQNLFSLSSSFTQSSNLKSPSFKTLLVIFLVEKEMSVVVLL